MAGLVKCLLDTEVQCANNQSAVKGPIQHLARVKCGSQAEVADRENVKLSCCNSYARQIENPFRGRALRLVKCLTLTRHC